jgi:peptidyl-prolyl cis-trans isomerase B (cyclophilin B)
MITPFSSRRGFIRTMLFVPTFLVTGALFAQDSSGSASGKAAEEVAVIKTTKGEMVVKFWSDKAPKTVENFKKLASEKFYDGTAFHRIIEGFMIQGGDPKTKDPANEDAYGTGDPGYKINAEFNDRKHVFGVISMARSAHPDSAGSQFFLMLGDAPFLDGKYTGFGQLIKGDEVLKTIGKTAVGPSRSGERSKPQERIEVKSVQIVKASELAK